MKIILVLLMIALVFSRQTTKDADINQKYKITPMKEGDNTNYPN